VSPTPPELLPKDIAAQAGEAPGRWFGAGAAVLGMAEGLQVERGVYDAVFDQKHPAGSNSAAAEPRATAERKLELQREAARLTRRPFRTRT